jgi:hypothetical protein
MCPSHGSVSPPRRRGSHVFQLVLASRDVDGVNQMSHAGDALAGVNRYLFLVKGSDTSSQRHRPFMHIHLQSSQGRQVPPRQEANHSALQVLIFGNVMRRCHFHVSVPRVTPYLVKETLRQVLDDLKKPTDSADKYLRPGLLVLTSEKLFKINFRSTPGCR